jgi:hypothetical protein
MIDFGEFFYMFFIDKKSPMSASKIFYKYNMTFYKHKRTPMSEKHVLLCSIFVICFKFGPHIYKLLLFFFNNEQRHGF